MMQDKRKPLSIPVPPGLAKILGYSGPCRYVGFYWMLGGEEVIYDDGRCSGTAARSIFLAFCRHPVVAGVLEVHDLGGAWSEAPEWLMLDREAEQLSVAPRVVAWNCLQAQHFQQPEQALQARGADRQDAESISEALDLSTWDEVPTSSEAVRRWAEQEQQALEALRRFLDEGR